MRRTLTARVLLLPSVCLCSFSAYALKEPSPDPTLKALLEKGVAKGYPGIAMLVENGDGHVRVAAAGFSNLEQQIPLRTTDGFHIASITKTFTAAAILGLIDKGKLSLDARLNELLPDAARNIPFAEQISVAQLLDHSSGIYATNNDPGYITTLIGPKADPYRLWSPAELVALANGTRRKPSGQPGSGHYYSDTNYVLLGMIVEKVSGQPFKAYIKQHLFEPLKMDSTFFYSDFVARKTLPTRVVQGYMLATPDIRKAVEINPMFKPVPNQRRPTGELLNTTLAAERIDAACGIVSNLDDMRKFGRALFGQKLLSADSQKFLTAAAQGMESEPMGKRRIRTLQAIRKPYGVLLYKEGDGPGGVNTLMAYQPEKRELYVGFTNIFGNFNEVEFMMDDVIGRLQPDNDPISPP
jgi:D-alanyl-D-alanine carboxypeptidase